MIQYWLEKGKELQIDKHQLPQEKKVAKQIADTIKQFKHSKKSDQVPFIGVAGTPGAGKSYFADNVKQLL